jgi:hypothetical protein
MTMKTPNEIHIVLGKLLVDTIHLVSEGDVEDAVLSNMLSTFFTLTDALYIETEEDDYNLTYVAGCDAVEHFKSKYTYSYGQYLKIFTGDHTVDWMAFAKDGEDECLPLEFNSDLTYPTAIFTQAITNMAKADAKGFAYARRMSV